MSDSEHIGNPLASFMNDLVNDRMLQHAHPQIIVIADNCAMAPRSRIQSYRKQHQTFLSSSVSSIPELSRWDSHPIRAEKHHANVKDSPCCTNRRQRKPQCPRRMTSFEGDRVEENTSNGKLDLQICPPKHPARRSSIGSSSSMGWSPDSSDDDESGPSSSSSSLLSSLSSFVLANTSPISTSDPSRLLSPSGHSWGGELSAKIQSERLNRSCMDLAPSGAWNVRPALPIMEFDDKVTLKQSHTEASQPEANRETTRTVCF